MNKRSLKVSKNGPIKKITRVMETVEADSLYTPDTTPD